MIVSRETDAVQTAYAVWQFGSLEALRFQTVIMSRSISDP
jgi:hypothetical protein